MAKTKNYGELFSPQDLSRFFDQYKAMPVDMKDMMETQRKNMQALSEASQCAVFGMQSIASRLADIMSQMVEDNAQLAQVLMTEGAPEDKIAKNAEVFKTLYERSVKNMNDLSETISKSGSDATSVINNRVSASMGEIRTALEKNKKKAA